MKKNQSLHRVYINSCVEFCDNTFLNTSENINESEVIKWKHSVAAETNVGNPPQSFVHRRTSFETEHIF